MQRLSLQQKLQQKLSPLQIQVIKLLEVPTMELEQRIKKELEENPALDEGREDEEQYDVSEEQDYETDSKDDDFSIDEYISDDDTPSYKLEANNHSKDDKKNEIPFSVGLTFYEHLLTQLNELDIDETAQKLAEYVIGNIDEDGYLRRDADSMADDLAFMQNINVETPDILKAIEIIQGLEPAGVAARDLQECLLLQLMRKDGNSRGVKIARRIIKSLFDEFSKRHYDRIMSRLNITEKDIKLAIDEILKLNPKPGSSYSNNYTKSIQYIIPDFILEEHNSELQLSLNGRNVPELKISRTYNDMLENFQANKSNATRTEKDAVMFVKQKLDSAKWFIEAIKQRYQTLMVVMQAIVDMQHDYFLEGDTAKLKPMHLKDIAERTKFDISTISRVSNSKYIQTNFGIFSLKSFFSDAMQTESGDEVSNKEIKAILVEAIEAEDKRKPLPDEKLMEILKQKGYIIARRTVAKYREQFNIPVARLRKEF